MLQIRPKLAIVSRMIIVVAKCLIVYNKPKSIINITRQKHFNITEQNPSTPK